MHTNKYIIMIGEENKKSQQLILEMLLDVFSSVIKTHKIFTCRISRALRILEMVFNKEHEISDNFIVTDDGSLTHVNKTQSSVESSLHKIGTFSHDESVRN